MENATLKPYDDYKPSGTEWIGEVPAHWNVRRMRSLVDISTGSKDTINKVAGGQYPFFVRSQVVEKIDTWSFEGEAVLTAGDGHVGQIFHYMNGKFDYHQRVYKFSGFRGVSGRFFYHYLERMLRFEVEQGTARTTVESLRLPMLQNFRVVIPPLDEQAAIVSYLDRADECIQNAISTKERLIELLTEQRQAVIHLAVTRGLDPNVRLKDSGMEWLADVPEHWDVMPIKRAFASMDYGISESASDQGHIRLLTMGHLRQGRVIVPPTGGVDLVAENLLLKKGDLLFNRTNSQELVGKVGLFAGYPSPVTFASYLVRLRPGSRHNSEYLNNVLNDRAVLSCVRREAIPSLHQSNLNPTRYGRIKALFPPLSEQNAIVHHLDKATADIDTAIDKAQRQIDLLREYRTRLIADVVTGQVDVRDVVEDEAELAVL